MQANPVIPAADMVLPCPEAGSQEISLGKVVFSVNKAFDESRARVKIVFLRPALRKSEAVDLYQKMISGLSEHVPHWQSFMLKQVNPERIVLSSFHEITSRVTQSKNTIFGGRFFVVAFEPEDATAEFIRAVAPSSYLIVVARKAYANANPARLIAADMAITIAKDPLALPGTNGFSVEDNGDVAPLVRNWIEGWIFGRNLSLVPMFGSNADLAVLRDRLTDRKDRQAADLVLLHRPPDGQFGTRDTGALRDALAARCEAGYLSLAMRHKYWGLLQNPNMTEAQRVSWLMRVGLRIQFVEKA